ncbi:hypothetical protein Lfu02_02950 [Longispora fulva]|uniref:SH3 domain-containing protein n=1 Tax=Longispora fulva TaxID=619741 RepID=A0A8J7GGQ7_9ACTN|nr:hypothetical protein [Longispora fulva]MBG6135833.1 hypothetical protein [Longispora fulva]GIG55923.1 hypothetical protein Lfu02_02950 [Longispora fulva]
MRVSGTVGRRLARAGVVAVAALVATTGAVAGGTPAFASGHGEGWYQVWGTNIAVRADTGEQCDLRPGPWNCPTVVTRVSAPQNVYVRCQNSTGQVVGGNPYWVWVNTYDGEFGWMASYYLTNASNRIDGVPDC